MKIISSSRQNTDILLGARQAQFERFLHLNFHILLVYIFGVIRTPSVNALNVGLALIHLSPDETDRVPHLARLDKDHINCHTTAG